MSAQYNSEYSKPTINSSACQYTNLGSYNGCNSSMPPLKPGVTSGVYLTPNYGAIGYDALTHGITGNCANYFNIQDAYGSSAGNCSTTYTSRLCGGGGCGYSARR
jgi:hypothetical protein